MNPWPDSMSFISNFTNRSVLLGTSILILLVFSSNLYSQLEEPGNQSTLAEDSDVEVVNENDDSEEGDSEEDSESEDEDDDDSTDEDERDYSTMDLSNIWMTVRDEDSSVQVVFRWGKFAVVLIGLFVWLRATSLIDDDGKHLLTTSWSRWVFGLGFFGVVAAFLSPDLIVSVGLVVAACGIPYWRYLIFRNGKVADTLPRLRWRHLLSGPRERFSRTNRVAVELVSNPNESTDTRKIMFLGNTLSGRSSLDGSGGNLKPATGFQMAISLIDQAVGKRATDLHLSTKENEIAVRLRVDGELITLDNLSLEMGLSVINVFKVLCDLNIADKRRSQDGSFRADVDGRRLSFRVSAQGTNIGEKLSIRILDPAYNFSSFSSLGMTEDIQRRLSAALERKFGLVLFAGATGAGKSTTAYAALRSLDPSERNIVTIEDPIEYSIPSIDQIEINARAGQTFESGLRSLLRQDADVVLVGEIRDSETCQTACQAATTGQLVLATLHGNDSFSAMFRLLDLGSDRHTVGAALRVILSQQLVRRLCTNCRIEYQASELAYRNDGLGNHYGSFFRRPEPEANTCLQCNGRGFLGRTGMFELLEVTQTLRDLIRSNAGSSEIINAARANGMVTLRDAAIRLIHEGIISVEDFDRIVDDP